MTMHVRVDEDVCQGHTLCNMAAPDVFGLREEDGHAYVLVSDFTPEIIESAKRAALTCPEQAIFVEESA
jgi:ferredoxin